jgi:hypothetical protein
MMDLKKIAQDLTHDLSRVVSDVKKEIVKITETHEEKIIRHLKEKGVNQISQETWSESSGNHNVIANSEGEILTDNSPDLNRILLNIALFAEQGETRLNKAMSGKTSTTFEKIEVPSQLTTSTKASQLIISQK